MFSKVTGIKQKEDFQIWFTKNYPSQSALIKYKKESNSFSYQPKISIVIILFENTNFIIQTIESIQKQIYSNWEIIITTPNSTTAETREKLELITKNNPKIYWIQNSDCENNFEAANHSINKSTGDYISILNTNDCISPDTLFQIAKAINSNRDTDFIYVDEDKIDAHKLHSSPYFKSDWCADNLLSRNYIGTFITATAELLKTNNGFNSELKEAAHYDLNLRLTEKAKYIHHIPNLLHHQFFKIEKSSDNHKKAIENALNRRGKKGIAKPIHDLVNCFEVRYEMEAIKKVSVIIPTKNKADLCETILSSIFSLTDYPNYEVILINNNSDEESFFELVKKWKNKEPQRFKCIHDNDYFNYSRLMNEGAKASNGDYILLLNNDMEILHADWMKAMVEYAQQKEIGVVGAKLFYPNDTIQHAGVVIGMGGVAADHVFVGFDRNADGYFGQLKCITNYSALTAACLMIRKEVFDEVNGFEEQLAVEFNDVDFCLKIKDKGYRNIYLPHVYLYHFESISRGHPQKTLKSYKQHVKDVAFFKSKWEKYIVHDPCYNKNLSILYRDYRLNIHD
ncbi:MAG: glycosyltransferase family 2 protein [Bacteroidia bacterium]|nr:glycosyltransferase family 2 protein [Bacteroidia bacterium]